MPELVSCVSHTPMLQCRKGPLVRYRGYRNQIEGVGIWVYIGALVPTLFAEAHTEIIHVMVRRGIALTSRIFS